MKDQQGELTTAKANHTNALKSVEDERDIVKRKLEVVEVEKEEFEEESRGDCLTEGEEEG